MWTEQTSDSDILYKVFPRTWAYAERLWTNPSKGAADLPASVFIFGHFNFEQSHRIRKVQNFQRYL